MDGNYKNSTPFAKVKPDLDAVLYHAKKFEAGSTYPLAKQCFQYWQILKSRSTYQVYMDEMEAKSYGTSTKP